MYFDERPKSLRRDLYDREEELRQLDAALQRRDPLILIYGLRRAGKTSLLQTAMRDLDHGIILDLRSLGTGAYATRKDLILALQKGINDFLSKRKTIRTKIIDTLKHVQGVQVGEMTVTFGWGGNESLDIGDLFGKLDRWALSNKSTITVAFDEAQELRKVAGMRMDKILAHIYDYCKNTSIVVTGSAMGLLYHFVGEEDPGAPLYGREKTEITLMQLESEQARDFLLKGFKQANKKIRDELIYDAVEKLDGIIGWLTMFGARCLKKGASMASLNEVVEQGSKLARMEFENFLQGREVARKRYEGIMRHLAKRPSTWSGIKGYLESREGRAMNDRKVTELVSTLVRASLVESGDARYTISDPLLAHSFE